MKVSWAGIYFAPSIREGFAHMRLRLGTFSTQYGLRNQPEAFKSLFGDKCAIDYK